MFLIRISLILTCFKFLNPDTEKLNNLACLDEAKYVLAIIEAMRASSKENSLIKVD